MNAPRVVIVGAGFAGYHAARGLQKRAPEAEIILINPTDYFLYLPLLPEVGAGVIEPRRICVSLTARLPGVRLLLGNVDTIDVVAHRVGWVDREGRRGEVDFDRLVLAALRHRYGLDATIEPVRDEYAERAHVAAAEVARRRGRPN